MNLSVRHIYKHFEGNEVLIDVSLEVSKGEILALTGESGCAKSTLLRIIAGLETPTKGMVFLNNENITDWKPENRRFGFVFQNLSLFPHLSVKENILFAARKKDQTRQKLDELLSMTGLDGLEKKYPHQLSGGQQQRVALARALAIHPQLLILDEPFSSIDELLKAKIREDVFELLRSLDITTILVSHQASDAFLIADQLVVMKNGKIQQKGTPTEIYQNPISPYVSDFFGASVILNGIQNEYGVITSFGQLNLSTNRNGTFKLFTRSENIHISNQKESNLRGRVLKKEFKGPHDVLKIASDNTNDFFTLETERCNIEVGKTIYLKVPENKIRIFN